MVHVLASLLVCLFLLPVVTSAAPVIDAEMQVRDVTDTARWFLIPDCPNGNLAFDMTTFTAGGQPFRCVSGIGGGAAGSAGTLQIANNSGGLAVYTGSSCGISGTAAIGISSTGALNCAPVLTSSQAQTILLAPSSDFPQGIDISTLPPGLLRWTGLSGISGLATRAAPTGDIVGTTDTQELDNKRINGRIFSLPTTTTPITNIDISLYDMFVISDLAQDTQIDNPQGTAKPAQWIRIQVRSSVPRAITWCSSPVGCLWTEGMGLPLPDVTSAGQDVLWIFQYNTITGTFDIIYNSQTLQSAELPPSGVTPGEYECPILTVNTFGIITDIESGECGGGEPGPGGTASAAGAYKDIQYKGTGDNLAADTGRFVYDERNHVQFLQQSVQGVGAGYVKLRAADGQETLVIASAIGASKVVDMNMLEKPGTLTIPNSTTLPATCSVGQAYMDTNATSGQRFYLCQAADTWVVQGDGGGGGGGLGDGDYGDITVSGTGTVLTIDNDVVTYAKIQNVSATDRVLCRDTAGAGDIEECAVTAPLQFTGGPGLSIADAVADGSTKGVATFTANDFNASSGNISLDYTNGQAASGSVNGFLASADWTTFNNKVATSRAIATTAPLAGGGDLSADRTLSIANAAADGSTKGAASFTAADFDASSGNISIDYTNGQAASGSNKGFLTSADWTTFNGKVSTSTTLTVAGTANEISSSAGAQDLSTNRTWTLSLPSTVNFSSKTVRIPNSTTLPGTCTVGDMYMDTDATSGQRFYLCQATNTWVAQGTAGGGTPGYRHLHVSAVKFPSSNPAQLDASENNWRLLFDASTQECIWWGFRLPGDYASTPVLKVPYSMTSATTGGVSIDVSVMAVTPGDSADANTDSYDTVNNCDDSPVPGTAGFLKEISCALTNNDSMAAGDQIRLKLCRAPADGTDTATGDMEVINEVTLEYAR